MEKTEDLMMNLATSMHDSNRAGSNYGKLFLLNELISILETKKKEIKEDIKGNSKFPDPSLDLL